jgi:hypothetical protein
MRVKMMTRREQQFDHDQAASGAALRKENG